MIIYEDKHKVLLVEDDQAQLYLYATVLLKANYLVDFAKTKYEAEKSLRHNRYALVIIDLNLPDGDGLEISNQLQAMQIPFMVITVRSQPEERVLGFESGAADYLIKPFMVSELLHRVRRILPDKPADIPEEEHLPIGPDLFLDANRRILLHSNGREVPLTRGEHLLLAELAADRGQTLSREHLGQVLGHDESKAQERTIDVLISRLRKKIYLFRNYRGLIQTVTGSGYRLRNY